MLSSKTNLTKIAYNTLYMSHLSVLFFVVFIAYNCGAASSTDLRPGKVTLKADNGLYAARC